MDVGEGRKFQGKEHNCVKHKALFLWVSELKDNYLVDSSYTVT